MPTSRNRKDFMIPIVLFMKTSEGLIYMNRSSHEFRLLTIFFSNYLRAPWDGSLLSFIPLISTIFLWYSFFFLNTIKFPESLVQSYFHKYFLILQRILKLKLEILIFRISVTDQFSLLVLAFLWWNPYLALDPPLNFCRLFNVLT